MAKAAAPEEHHPCKAEGEGGFWAQEIFWEEEIWVLIQDVGACSLPRTCWKELLFQGLFEASTFPPMEKGWGKEKGGVGVFLLKEFQGFNLLKK